MSMKAYRWAKKQMGLSSPEKFVLIMLADYYNDAWDRAWPSPSTLAADTSLGVSTVKRSLRSLQEKGLIVAEQWMLNDGAVFMPNRYLLPVFNPSVLPAHEQPVLACAIYDVSAQFDDLLEVPGTGLYIESWMLNSDPTENPGWSSHRPI